MYGNRTLYIASILAVGIATLIGVINPLVIRVTIDSIIGNKPIDVPRWALLIINKLGGKTVLAQNLWISGIVFVILSILNGIFLYFKGKWSAVASESVAKNIRDRLYDHIQRLPYDYHVNVETGDLIQRCTSDVETIRRFLSVQFVEIGRVVFMLIFVLCIMFSLDVKMTFVSMAVVPFIFVAAIIFFIKVKKSFQASDEAEAKLSTVLQENLTGIRVVKAFARQKFEIEKFDEKNIEYRDLTYKLIRLLAWYWSISDLACLLQIGAVLVFGAYMASMNFITLGTLVVFISYEKQLIYPVRQMGRILTDLGKALVSLERIGEILDIQIEELEDTTQMPEIKGEIEFKNVCFEYEKGVPILQNISFKVKKGETIAILGATGSGKSTLMYLLPRLYDYQKGEIKIDGIDIKKINKKWLRKNIGIVLQEPFLFSKTIKENIAIALKDIKDEKIYEYAKIACIHNAILDFEKGYETPVGERGVTLSGGQKQRIAIARTLTKECPILIFDDSLSAVDTETDKAIRTALKEKRKDTTTFIISHRINSIADADLILVLDKGKIVQSGNHEKLIAEDGIYKRIWDLQNSLEQELRKDLGLEKIDEVAS